jgi:hypothetical protein
MIFAVMFLLQQTRNPNGGAIAIGHPAGRKRRSPSDNRNISIADGQCALRSLRHVHCGRPRHRDDIECLLKSPLICAGEENGQTSLLQLLMYGLFAGIAVR